jgi:hypothetical protein
VIESIRGIFWFAAPAIQDAGDFGLLFLGLL